MKVINILLVCLVLWTGAGCTKKKQTEWYHPFSGHAWERFNILRFEIPVTEPLEDGYDVVFFTWLSPGFEYTSLDFNMIMTTPAGEERIMEYQLPIRSGNGTMLIHCQKDSCNASLSLKRSLKLSKPGTLVIEIENLTPRLLTEGIYGTGIRLTPSPEK